MWIIPAIDILHGQCVRLRQGDYAATTTYHADPLAVAEDFFARGVRRLHVVDLDAAKSGAPVNSEVITRILSAAKSAGAAVQVGGGLRTPAAVEAVFAAGASFAILGTAAVKNPSFRQAMLRQYPDRMIIGMDCRDNRIAVSGWTQEDSLPVGEFISDLNAQPPAAVVFTDITRDGMLAGVNAPATAAVGAQLSCPVIASGGVHTVADIAALQTAGHVAGVIIGQAIYQKTIDLEAALAMSADANTGAAA